MAKNPATVSGTAAGADPGGCLAQAASRALRLRRRDGASVAADTGAVAASTDAEAAAAVGSYEIVTAVAPAEGRTVGTAPAA